MQPYLTFSYVYLLLFTVWAIFTEILPFPYMIT